MILTKLRSCFRDTKQVIRFIVLIFCILVSGYQLAQCFKKIQRPPISTHYGFRMNDTLKYPAVTICRDPGFKTSLFEKFGFQAEADIDLSSTWQDFKFGQYSLSDFFEETTYGLQEVIKVASLDKKQDKLQVSSFFTLMYGRCFTLTPRNESKNWGSKQGYTVIFTVTKDELNGYHVYIHDDIELFSEKSHEADIFREYLYVETKDNIQVNLKMNKYNQLPNRHNNCNPGFDYSKSKCVENAVNQMISEEVGCSSPWVPNEHLPFCNTSNQTVKMVDYSTPSIWLETFITQASCTPKCNATTYMPFMQSIRQSPFTIVKIFFASNLFTVMEEVVGYDWNSFLSDLGGSLGFLLGLSVLGMIGIAENFVMIMMKMRGGKKGKMEVARKQEEPGEVTVSCVEKY